MSWTNPPTDPSHGSGAVPFAGFPLPDLVVRQLRPGERVLWAGRPGTGRLVRLTDLPALGFGALWTTIVLTAMSSIGRSDAPVLVRVFFVGFLLIGVSTAFGGIVMRGLRLRRTVYAVTDQRVLTLTGETLQANDVRHITETRVTVRPDGSGDLFFTGEFDQLAQLGQLPPQVQRLAFSLASSQRTGLAIGFQAIPDVLAVQAIVEGLRQGLS
ncbi:MAG TPA: hypothetical protein VFW55_10275 [Propionicimonas sp.]|nr:hypothetical protein [Propionicimonas sp.]